MNRDPALISNNTTHYQGVVERFSFEAASLKSNIANEDAERHIVVYLPPSYAESPKREYPIVYMLHGMDSHPESWFDQTATNLGIRHIMNNLGERGDIEDMIVVAVDGRSSIKGAWYLNSPISGNFFDYLTQDMINETENRYRVKKGKRGICGHSMGGFGALYATMLHPELYQACAALSPGGMIMREHRYQQHAEFFKNQVEAFTKGEECEWFFYAYLAILRAIAPDRSNPPSYIIRDMDAAMRALEQFHLSAIAKKRAPFINKQGKYTAIGARDINAQDELPIYAEIGSDEGEAAGEPILENFQKMIATFEELEIPITHHVFEGGHIDKVGEQIDRGIRFIDASFKQ
ncbi:esterase [Enterovibrio norvegicus FF-162]|uniref:Esterase n=1 Tax=Enterovibrio norvegicus FF-454 TaxID=1185651 RepID=A0A1E5CC46_9GAMM|nr:alpha/beta hydrolase-fold protein [Enterovibrio norvegicus]OEE63078.1 esterase [Enterovibrio norvegicus FF-454]OEE74702.1 esterase [Enterovibrio norvegicus FF-162]